MAIVNFISDGTPIHFVGEIFDLAAGDHTLASIEKDFGAKLKAHNVSAEDLVRHADAQGRMKPVDSNGKLKDDEDVYRRYKLETKKG